MTRYVVVWALLVGLTLLSFAFSMAHLGAVDIAIALGIALAKSALVLLYFMHLSEHRGTNTFFVGAAVFFVALLVGLMAFDVLTRETFPRAPSPPTLR
jgi:cytochrome c oxidase subunit 4